MTIATLFLALIATTAAENPGDPVLLDFSATWCGPCQTMRPEVEKLVQKGYPVKFIDIDRSPEMSDRYKVKAVPTFVVIDSKGKVLARTSGAMPAAQLAAFYNETKLKTASSTPPVEEAEDRGKSDEVSSSEEASPSPAPVVNPKPWETVVRIKMHLSNTEWGFGSGTIIYSSQEESIILTCAHIFRVKGQKQPSPKNFRVPISVDLFDGQLISRQQAQVSCAEKDIPGEAIDYDFDNDVGLIRIRPGRKLASSRVVPAYWQPKKGMKMYTVGCSHGADATAWDTTILDPKVTMSNTETKKTFSEIKCANQPKEGRSGGGLYTTDGYVAGVCDFADPNERVGLYAVPEAIHRLLDRNQYTALYKPSTSGAEGMLATNTSKSKGSQGTKVRAQSAEEATDTVTLPPPSLVGISSPSRDGNSWRSGNTEKGATRNQRRNDQTDVALAVPGSMVVRPGEARQTDLNIDPGPDARAEESQESPVPDPAPKRPTNPTTPASKGPNTGWKPARQPLPDLVGSGTTNR